MTAFPALPIRWPTSRWFGRLRQPMSTGSASLHRLPVASPDPPDSRLARWQPQACNRVPVSIRFSVPSWVAAFRVQSGIATPSAENVFLIPARNTGRPGKAGRFAPGVAIALPQRVPRPCKIVRSEPLGRVCRRRIQQITRTSGMQRGQDDAVQQRPRGCRPDLVRSVGRSPATPLRFEDLKGLLPALLLTALSSALCFKSENKSKAWW